MAQPVIVAKYGNPSHRVTWDTFTWPLLFQSEKSIIIDAMTLNDQHALLLFEHQKGLDAVLVAIEGWRVEERLTLTESKLRNFAFCRLADDRVALVGGSHSSSSGNQPIQECSNEVITIDTAPLQIQSHARLPSGRCFTTNTAFGLNDGTLLVVGGTPDRLIPDLAIPEPGSDLPIFDILSRTGEVLKSGTMSQARFWPATFMLENGDVVIAGGGVNDPDTAPPGSLAYLATKSVEIFDNHIQEFHSSQELPWPLACSTVVTIANNKYAVIGGGQSGIDDPSGLEIDQTLVFLPDTETFEPGPRLQFPRIGPICIALSNTVIVLGGEKTRWSREPDWEILEF